MTNTPQTPEPASQHKHDTSRNKLPVNTLKEQALPNMKPPTVTWYRSHHTPILEGMQCNRKQSQQAQTQRIKKQTSKERNKTTTKHPRSWLFSPFSVFSCTRVRVLFRPVRPILGIVACHYPLTACPGGPFCVLIGPSGSRRARVLHRVRLVYIRNSCRSIVRFTAAVVVAS